MGWEEEEEEGSDYGSLLHNSMFRGSFLGQVKALVGKLKFLLFTLAFQMQSNLKGWN